MQIIKLKSSDDQVFDVDVKVASCSVTIKTMLEDLGMPDDEEPEIIPLPNVTGSVLKKVLEWAEYHKDDPIVDEDEEDSKPQEVSDWDQEFLKVDQPTLFSLILAANYLNVKGLLDSTCKVLANLIKGKTPDEIRKICNIKDDSKKQENQVCEPEKQIEKEKEKEEDTKMTLRSQK